MTCELMLRLMLYSCLCCRLPFLHIMGCGCKSEEAVPCLLCRHNCQGHACLKREAALVCLVRTAESFATQAGQHCWQSDLE